jgi:septal ring factor EnvC (AmiA/AmiB activator)
MKTVKLLVAACMACFLMACATAEDKYENNVKKLDALITELEQQESVSKDDWKKAEAMLNELQISEKDLENLTEEQAEEYGKLAGRLTKLAMKQGVNSVNDAMDKVNGFLKEKRFSKKHLNEICLKFTMKKSCMTSF